MLVCMYCTVLCDAHVVFECVQVLRYCVWLCETRVLICYCMLTVTAVLKRLKAIRQCDPCTCRVSTTGRRMPSLSLLCRVPVSPTPCRG